MTGASAVLEGGLEKSVEAGADASANANANAQAAAEVEDTKDKVDAGAAAAAECEPCDDRPPLPFCELEREAFFSQSSASAEAFERFALA